MKIANPKFISPYGIGAREPHFAEMKKAKLVSILEDLSTADLIDVHNHYCEENRYYDDEIHSMDLLPEYLYGIDPMCLLWRVQENDFRINHDYFKMDEDNLCSYNEWKAREEIDVSDLANWIIRTGDDCDCEPVQEFVIYGLGA